MCVCGGGSGVEVKGEGGKGTEEVGEAVVGEVTDNHFISLKVTQKLLQGRS